MDTASTNASTGAFPRKLEPRQRVGADRAEDDGDDRGGAGDDQRVANRRPEVAAVEERAIVIEHQRARHEHRSRRTSGLSGVKEATTAQ